MNAELLSNKVALWNYFKAELLPNKVVLWNYFKAELLLNLYCGIILKQSYCQIKLNIAELL